MTSVTSPSAILRFGFEARVYGSSFEVRAVDGNGDASRRLLVGVDGESEPATRRAAFSIGNGDPQRPGRTFARFAIHSVNASAVVCGGNRPKYTLTLSSSRDLGLGLGFRVPGWGPALAPILPAPIPTLFLDAGSSLEIVVGGVHRAARAFAVDALDVAMILRVDLRADVVREDVDALGAVGRRPGAVFDPRRGVSQGTVDDGEFAELLSLVCVIVVV